MILTSLNGQPFNGLMQTLVYEVMGYGSSIQTNQVWTILGDATLARFNCLDYTQNGQFEDQSLIIDKPNGLQVLSAFQSHSNFYINTSNNLYTINLYILEGLSKVRFITSASQILFPLTNIVDHQIRCILFRELQYTA